VNLKDVDMDSRERAIKSGIIFIFVLILILLGIGMGIWVGRMCGMILEFAVTGVVISQILTVLGIREIILFGHNK
jgi:hypothetical protein